MSFWEWHLTARNRNLEGVESICFSDFLQGFIHVETRGYEEGHIMRVVTAKLLLCSHHERQERQGQLGTRERNSHMQGFRFQSHPFKTNRSL